MHQRFSLQRTLARTAIGIASGSLLLGSGCDPTVRSAILTGFQQLSTALVNAIFLSIEGSTDTTTTGTGTSTSGNTSTTDTTGGTTDTQSTGTSN